MDEYSKSAFRCICCGLVAENRHVVDYDNEHHCTRCSHDFELLDKKDLNNIKGATNGED